MLKQWFVSWIFLVLLVLQVVAGEVSNGYVMLLNGKDLAGWILSSTAADSELRKQVFVMTDDGAIHFFGDLPDRYGTNPDEPKIRGLMRTEKSYSRFSLKFEYKWGTKTFTTSEARRYDSGCCYRMLKEKIWPWGLEYQVRYDPTRDRNYTGDLWNNGSAFQWFAGADDRYLPFAEGGRPVQPRGGLHSARSGAVFHGPDGEWNQCEIIVMGNKYAIHKLNGKVVNMLINLKHGEGPIGFQAETTEIYYRNILIRNSTRNFQRRCFLKRRGMNHEAHEEHEGNFDAD